MQTLRSADEWFAGHRKLVVHYHIFKNAGTSVDQYLLSQFGQDWLPFEGQAGHEPIPAIDLAQHLSTHPTVESVSSHKLRPAPLAGYNVLPIILLRDPLDRAYSCYSHSRRSTDKDESCYVARSTDFPGYVQWCLDNPARGGVVIINYQTVHLSNASWRGPIYSAVANRDDLKQAIRLIESLPVPGTVDRFDDFLVQLNTIISMWSGRHLPQPETIRANISPERAIETLEEKRSFLRALLGTSLLARFDEMNRLDHALWAYAHARSLNGLEAFEIPRPSNSRTSLRPTSPN